MKGNGANAQTSSKSSGVGGPISIPSSIISAAFWFTPSNASVTTFYFPMPHKFSTKFQKFNLKALYIYVCVCVKHDFFNYLEYSWLNVFANELTTNVVI